MDEIDKDIKRTEEEINALLRVKDAKLKNLLDIFDFNQHGFHKFRSGLEESCKTMRKLPLFGFVEGCVPNFEWPLKEDLLAMPLDAPIKAVSLKWL